MTYERIINIVLIIAFNLMLSIPVILMGTGEAYYAFDLLMIMAVIVLYTTINYSKFKLINHASLQFLYKEKKICLHYDKFLILLLIQILLVRTLVDFTISEITENIVIMLLIFLLYQIMFLRSNFKNINIIELIFVYCWLLIISAIGIVSNPYFKPQEIGETQILNEQYLTLINFGLIFTLILLIGYVHHKYNNLKLIDLSRH